MSNVNPLDLSYHHEALSENNENLPSPLSYTITLLPEEAPKEVYQETSQQYYEFKSPLGDQSNIVEDNVTQSSVMINVTRLRVDPHYSYYYIGWTR